MGADGVVADVRGGGRKNIRAQVMLRFGYYCAVWTANHPDQPLFCLLPAEYLVPGMRIHMRWVIHAFWGQNMVPLLYILFVFYRLLFFPGTP